MELKDAIYGRRSIRKFKDIPISEEDIREIVEAGTMAPSGTNIQPWYYVAIAHPETLEELRKIAAKGAEGATPMLAERFKDHPEVVKPTTSFIATFGNAPLVVLVFLRPQNVESGRDTMIQGIGAGIQNMLLTAYEKGIGSCWMTALISGGVGEEIRLRFAPDKGELVATVAFGYSEQDPKMPKRKDDRSEFIL